MNAKEFAAAAAKSATRVGLVGLIRNEMTKIVNLEGLIKEYSDDRPERLVEAQNDHVERLCELHAVFLKGVQQ